VHSSSSPSPTVLKLLPRDLITDLRGQKVTLGSWIWADRPVQIRFPEFGANELSFSTEIQVDTKPQFFANTITVPENANHGFVKLSPTLQTDGPEYNVYYDGLILVKGEFSNNHSPQLNNPSGHSGTWDGKGFTNLVRGGSAETAGFYVRPWAEKYISRYFPGSASLILGVLKDPQSAFWYIENTTENMLRTFWAKFGWGHVPLVGYRPYLILSTITLLGLVGAGLALWRRRQSISWEILFFLGAALVIVWGAAVMRGIQSLLGLIFIPSARYAYPAIIPSMLVLSIGWMELFHLLEKRINFPKSAKYFVFWGFFITLNLLSIASIYRYYYT
jgi:hypothetical protein